MTKGKWLLPLSVHEHTPRMQYLQASEGRGVGVAETLPHHQSSHA